MTRDVKAEMAARRAELDKRKQTERKYEQEFCERLKREYSGGDSVYMQGRLSEFLMTCEQLGKTPPGHPPQTSNPYEIERYLVIAHSVLEFSKIPR